MRLHMARMNRAARRSRRGAPEEYEQIFQVRSPGGPIMGAHDFLVAARPALLLQAGNEMPVGRDKARLIGADVEIERER
jgi:hypothetical protein